MLSEHLTLIRDRLNSNKADAMIMHDIFDVSWFLNLNSQVDFCLIVVTNKAAACFIDARDYDYFKKNVKDIDIICYKDIKTWKHYVNKLGVKKIMVPSNNTTIDKMNKYINILKFKQIIEFNSDELRIVKSKNEIDLLIYASKIACSAIVYAKQIIKVGMTEKNLAELICKRMFALGATALSFAPIVAFGENSSNIHHVPSNRKLEKNEIVLVDIGCVYKGYCSDITRTWFFGEKPTPLMKKVFDIVLQANQIGIQNSLNGTKTRKIDKLVRTYVSRQFDKYDFPHGTGHGVGVKVHELPRINKIDDHILNINNVFSIEPGIYIKKFGIRLEDLVVVQKDKPLVLTEYCPKTI